MVSQLHQLLLELIPGGAKKDLSAAQAKALLAKVRPRDAAGKTRRRVAAELIGDLERIYARKKAANKELKALLAATGTTLIDLHGIGPSGAARLLVEVGDITRFPTKRTSRPGTAPHPSTPPPVTRSATDCPGAGTARSTGSCTSWPPSSCATPPKDAPTSTARKPTARHRWKRCARLKRRLSDIVYRHMLDDASPRREDGPGRATGTTTLTPARPAHIPTPALRTSHFPDPPPAQPKTPLPAAVLTQRGAMSVRLHACAHPTAVRSLLRV